MTGIFAPQYYGSVNYYATMMGCDRAIIDLGMRFDKRFKSVHRCQIADTRGPLLLTVPISRPSTQDKRLTECLKWQQVRVSDHGEWWSDHRISLESAYGRTPFFEFYIDRLLPYLHYRDIPVTEFDREIDATIRSILHLETAVEYIDCGKEDSLLTPDTDIVDLRSNIFPGVVPIEYYQVRGLELGFIANLSILDLIFNMGPESPLILHAMLQHHS